MTDRKAVIKNADMPSSAPPRLEDRLFRENLFLIFDENSTFGEVIAIDREERRPRHDQWRSQGGP